MGWLKTEGWRTASSLAGELRLSCAVLCREGVSWTHTGCAAGSAAEHVSPKCADHSARHAPTTLLFTTDDGDTRVGIPL